MTLAQSRIMRDPKTTTNASRGLSGDRAPLPESHPKAVKRNAGRALLMPAHVRVAGVQLDQEQREYIRRKLGARLTKFARSIERVTVRVTDVNGPRGGVDQVCRIKVVLTGLPSVVVEERHADARAAIDAALRAIQRPVRRAVDRRRMMPLHGRTRRIAKQRRPA
jgi:ribosome-associated translation inhibitor RaiA